MSTSLFVETRALTKPSVLCFALVELKPMGGTPVDDVGSTVTKSAAHVVDAIQTGAGVGLLVVGEKMVVNLMTSEDRCDHGLE